MSRVPKLCRHRTKKVGYVTLSGKEVYLGPWPDDGPAPGAVQAAYDRVVAEWLLRGKAPTPDAASALTVAELLAAYVRHAETYYVKAGKPTSQIWRVKRAARYVVLSYGPTPAAEFGPLALEAVREKMVAADLCRPFVNQLTGCARRAWKWAASRELVPAETYQRLRTLEDLKRGRCRAPDPPPVGPVPWKVVEVTLPWLPPTIADMVRLQYQAGMRPGEVVVLRPCDVDREGRVKGGGTFPGLWVYTPPTHKTEHHDEDRVIFLGAKAQAILTPYLDGDPTAPAFSPAETVRRFRADQRCRRKSKVQPSQADRSKRRPKKQPGTAYTSNSYRQAVVRAVRRARSAWVPLDLWTTNQLRHSRATEIRRLFSQDTARTVLGHASVEMTDVYAERDLNAAAEVMRKIG